MFLNLNETDLVTGVQQATGGKGVDIVLDTLGAKLLSSCLGRSELGEGR